MIFSSYDATIDKKDRGVSMKFCTNCGEQLVDNAGFCSECGSASADRFYTAQPDYSNIPLLSQDAVLNTAKGRFRSLPFLITAAALSIFLVYTLIISAFRFVETANMESAVSIVGIHSVVNCVPVAMLAVGMWMLYYSASDKREEFKTKGLTVIKVASIIALVLIVISLVTTAAYLIKALCSIYDTFSAVFPDAIPEGQIDESYAGVALIWYLFVGLGVIAFWIVLFAILICVLALIPLSIFYFVKMVKTVNVIKSTIITGTVTGKVSVVVAILSIIVGGLLAFAGLSGVGYSQLGTGLSMIPIAIAFIFFGVFLLSYRSKINALLSA